MRFACLTAAPSRIRAKRVAATILTAFAIVAERGAMAASEAGRAFGTLSISTDPAGADVFVDGRPVGQAPTEVRTVAVGSHRVRVVKPGFLENARVVDVAAARPTAVRVTLTRAATESREGAGQVISGSKPKGSLLSNKWLWIGAAGAGGAAAALLSSSAKENLTPVIGSVNVGPNSGLQGATVISFTAVGVRDPESAPITFTWDFGDGTTGSGEATTHVYNVARTFSASVSVSDGKNTAVSNGSVTIVSLTGAWRGSNAAYSLTLTHAGSVVSATWDDVTGGLSRRWSGNGAVTPPRNLALTLTPVLNANGPLSISATLDSTGNILTGSVTGFSSPFNLDVRR
jgi:archaellum component FlaG (FlaF/FlaG flagellin family)